MEMKIAVVFTVGWLLNHYHHVWKGEAEKIIELHQDDFQDLCEIPLMCIIKL